MNSHLCFDFMVRSFADGWCESPIVNALERTTHSAAREARHG